MKKITATILSALTFTALCASGTALLHAQTLPASAQTNTVTAELVAPTSYEQYLALDKPKAVAATNGYLAIADGKSVYVFDQTDDVYREYTHTADVQKLAFDGNGNLYFLSDLHLYKLSPQALKNGEAASDVLVCEGFAIQDDVLCYYKNSTALTFRSLSLGADVQTVDLPSALQSKSPLAFGNDGLYCVTKNENDQNGYTVYAINLTTYAPTPITKVQEELSSMAIANSLFCFISKGEFFSYNLTEFSASENASDIPSITHETGDYLSLGSYAGNVYAIRGNIVRHYLVEGGDAAFTDYEIGASSASSYRLNGGAEVALNENRLFIAENGNERISVYDTQTQVFGDSITSEYSVSYLASHKNTLLVASDTQTTVYDLRERSYGKPLLSMKDEDIEGKIVGVASVYGRYYVLTESNYCYTLSKESGEWAWTQMQKNTQTLSAVSFTADVYGSLYIAYDDNGVYRFTEKELLNADARGEKVLENLSSPEKISVDYNTDLYALSNGTITKYTQNEGGMYALSASYTPDYQLVKDQTPHVRSFTFGLDNAFTYLLYEGDYIVRTDELNIPAVNPIPVGNAHELLFGQTNADFSVVTVETDAILIEFDPAELSQGTEFPYTAFERTQNTQTALKIGEEGEYSLVAIAKQRTGDYKTCLVLTSSCAPLVGEYKTEYPTPKTGYLTNEVALYKFPYLHELLTLETLARGTEVSLLGEVIKLDHAYYQILVNGENGEVKTGFIPKSYVTLFNGSTPVPETVISGATQTDDDGVWRSAYIILGFGVIIILVDFLILHKRKEEE